MTTEKKENNSKQKIGSPLIPYKYQHAASIVVIFLSLIVFFHEVVLESRVFVAADTIASKSFETLINDAEQQGSFPLWNPYIFCGMPGYASLMVHGERYFDVTAWALGKIVNLFGVIVNNPDIGWGLFYYFVLGAGMYWLSYEKLNSKIAALVSGLAVMHSTFIIILIMVGHMTKVPVIAFFPFIFLVLERLREKFNGSLTVALVVLIHFLFLPSHFQIIFYCYFAIGLYYLFFFIRALMKKEAVAGIIRSGAIFTVATGLAFAMTGDQYLSTLEYSKYSMRGSDPIVSAQQSDPSGSSAGSGGLDYDYATNWSFSPGEVLSFFIPSSHGFGWHSYRGLITQNQEMRLNTYFGNMPFTDAPQYMGIVVLVLAGIGFWRNRKDPFVQYVALLIGISLFISFGKEFPLLYDLMFNYFPMFNKFRIPSMMLIIVQIMVPVLAGYGFVAMVNDAKEKKSSQSKTLMYSLIGISVLLVVSMISKDILLSVYSLFFSPQEIQQSLSRSYGTNQAVLGELYKIVLGMVATDISFGLLLVGMALGGIYLYQRSQLKYSALGAGIVVIILFDLWRVNYKPMETHHRQQAEGHFTTPDYVSFLKHDTTHFRILEFEKGQPPYNNTLAYWRIQSAYGYSGTKMRQIQDAFDVVGMGNPVLWGLMNVKYIISDRLDSNMILQPVFSGSGKNVLYNRAELPRLFFVNRYAVASGLDILNNIKVMNFDPKEIAFFLEDPNIDVEPPDSGASAVITRYGMQELEIAVSATGNNLLFLSESWYPEGWTAFLDGTEIPIHRINYMFRGLVVPKGEHVITMRFEPAGFEIGKNLSLWLNIVVIGAGIFYVVRFMKKRPS
ncbi:MAG: YfhO family protein [Bacteroidota bacterium]